MKPLFATPRRPSLRWCRSVMGDEPRRVSGWVWGLLILVVLAVFGLVAVPTEGAKHLFINHLHQATGLNVTLGTSRIGWPYDLVLNHLVLADAESPSLDGRTPPLLRLDELRFGWRGRRGWRVTVRGGHLTLRSGDDGRPRPLGWAGLADVEDCGAIAAWMERLWGGEAVRLHAEQMTIDWVDGEGQAVTHAENVRLISLPLNVPRRSWRFFELAADRVLRADGHWRSEVVHEWLVSGATQVVRLGYRAADPPLTGTVDPGEE